MDFKIKRLDAWVLGICAVVFFLSTSVLWLGVPWIFNSPDENANAFFAEAVRVADRLTYTDPANLHLGGILHPRSVIAVGAYLAPGSFLGLPVIYGLLGKVVGLGAMRLLTPLLAITAVFAWRALVQKITGSTKVALIASLTVLFHPALWYYASRSMMHNVPFVSLLIISAWFFLLRPWQNKRWWWMTDLLAGICFAGAAWFRTSELVWMIPVLAVLCFVYRRALGWQAILRFAFTAIIAMTPMLFINQHLYGSLFTTGYTFSEATTDVIATTESATAVASPLAPFHPAIKPMLKHIWQYGASLFPWMSFLALGGFALAIKKRAVPKSYLWLTVLLSAWLFAFYGSWTFNDNPDPALVTIGTSYVRYWLPIFILISPYVAMAIVWIGQRLALVSARSTVMGLLVALFLLNIYPVFYAVDGLVSLRQNLFAFADERQQIMNATEANAIIITDRADKLLWPYRRVVQPLRSEATYTAMPALVQTAPVYYVGITFPQSDLDYLNQQKLPPLGLSIALVQTLGAESLYRLYETP